MCIYANHRLLIDLCMVFMYMNVLHNCIHSFYVYVSTHAHVYLCVVMQIPATETTYMCSTYTLPNATKYHVTRIRPIVTTNLIHHMIIYVCVKNINETTPHPYVNHLHTCTYTYTHTYICELRRVTC